MEADFVAAADSPALYPKLGLPEIAFAGRSNVGKSSLINALLQRRGLIRTSKDPGCTRRLGFVRVGNRVVFVDFPGYGYAKVSQAERARWKPMVEGYLSQRQELALVLLLVDSRRVPGDLEVDFLAWLRKHAIPFGVVATKVDKLGRSAREARIRDVAREFGLDRRQVTGFSAVTGEGKAELWSAHPDAPPARHGALPWTRAASSAASRRKRSPPASSSRTTRSSPSRT
jgi:GTP-binding protein